MRKKISNERVPNDKAGKDDFYRAVQALLESNHRIQFWSLQSATEAKLSTEQEILTFLRMQLKNVAGVERKKKEKGSGKKRKGSSDASSVGDVSAVPEAATVPEAAAASIGKKKKKPTLKEIKNQVKGQRNLNSFIK